MEKRKEIMEVIGKRIYKGVNIIIGIPEKINRLHFLQIVINRMRQHLFDDLKNKTRLEGFKVIKFLNHTNL